MPGLTALLLLIRGGSEYKQFVGNRVRKIKEKESVIWRHVLLKRIPLIWGVEVDQSTKRMCCGGNDLIG